MVEVTRITPRITCGCLSFYALGATPELWETVYLPVVKFLRERVCSQANAVCFPPRKFRRRKYFAKMKIR